MKLSEKGERLLKASEGSLEIEKLEKYLSLMEKTHSLLSEFMVTIVREGGLDENERDKAKNLLKCMKSSVSQIGSTAQHILDIANKNQKVRSDDVKER